MIRVAVTLSSESVIETLEVVGHAGFALKGTDIVCSAVTVLLRTFFRSVEASPYWEGDLRSEKEGFLFLKTRNVGTVFEGMYSGYCWFLLRGLEDLVRDYPEHVEMNFQKTTGRLFHGS